MQYRLLCRSITAPFKNSVGKLAKSSGLIFLFSSYKKTLFLNKYWNLPLPEVGVVWSSCGAEKPTLCSMVYVKTPGRLLHKISFIFKSKTLTFKRCLITIFSKHVLWRRLGNTCFQMLHSFCGRPALLFIRCHSWLSLLIRITDKLLNLFKFIKLTIQCVSV